MTLPHARHALLLLLLSGLVSGGVRVVQAQEENQDLVRKDNKNFHMVAIEALVIEVTEGRTRDLGIQYGYNRGNTAESIDGVNVDLGSSFRPVSVPVLVKGANGTNSVNFQNRLPGLGINLTGMSIGSGAFSARLRALLQQGDAQIRTRPIAVALNGTEVDIKATSKIPYQDAANNNNLVVSFQDVGVRMTVTPTIQSLRPGRIRIQISKLEVSSVSNFLTSEEVDRPVFSTSETNTIVTLAESETFVLSGLKKRETINMNQKVPILGSIPLIGRFFSNTMDVERRKDVLFFITPHIVAPGENILLPYDFRNQQALGIDVNLASR